jgi:hypothetical protein
MNRMIEKIREQIESLIYPQLRSYGRMDRDRLLREAAKTPLAFIEWARKLTTLTAMRSAKPKSTAL